VEDGHWVVALLPVFDAVERLAVQAESLATTFRESWCPMLPAGARAERALSELARGLEAVQKQVDDTLNHLGVEVDRELYCPLDPRRHHVVQARREPGVSNNSVIEVLRPGYRVGAQRIRAADVVLACEYESG
jgi:molecular chaperone GrpE